MASITFSIIAPAAILEKCGLGASAKVQTVIDNEVLKRCEPYVPKKSGALIASGRAATAPGSGLITYGANYAAYQYYGISSSGKALEYNGAPMRGSYWFERMKAANKDAILRLAADAAGAKADKGAANKPAFIPPLNQPLKTVIGLRRNPVFR